MSSEKRLEIQNQMKKEQQIRMDKLLKEKQQKIESFRQHLIDEEARNSEKIMNSFKEKSKILIICYFIMLSGKIY